MVQSLSEAAVCKLFPTTLKGPAVIWYQSLKEGSIRSFDEFNAEAVEVGNLNDDTVIDAMKDNTTMMAFRDNLITNPVQTYSQLMDRAWNYINLDEEQRRKATQTTTQFQTPRPTFSQTARQDRFRPRNQQQNNNEPVRYPPKLQYEGDRKKYCKFHDGHGHVTDECGSLKKKIDRLVQVGRLKDFVAQRKNYNSGGSYRGEHSGKREEAPPPKIQNVSGVINTIAGGMAGPEYKRGRRKRQKVVMNISVAKPLPEVSFDSADGEGIDFPH
ncbi:uncharacterized protein LOC126657025 [Mercurialis annua]|uniref:uncharacterized protein LOC126657025 n=1 Tax=Mercurialis annua TaxID=3986 RepID=UPI00215FD3CF|nr:uncharacterized protein LOC126657025 [Mercurialis annua]